MNLTPEIITELSLPFPKDVIEIKAGATNAKAKGGTADKALALAYADARAYQDRLDLVVGPHNWTVSYTPLEGKAAFICRLTVCGVSKEDVGESGPDENAHTSAAMQSFKRACSAFGIGRYLYHLPNTKWVAYDGQRKNIPQDEQQKVIDWFYTTARLQLREPRPMYPIETVAELEDNNQKIAAPLATRGETPQPQPSPQYKHLRKDGMDVDTLVRKATAYQREKADHLAENQGYVFTRPLNDYNEVEMRHIIEFLEGKRDYHRVSVFIKKVDLVERLDETSPAEDEQRKNFIEAFLTAQGHLERLNADIDGSPHLTKCYNLDIEACPIEHLQKAVQIMGDAILQLEVQEPETTTPPESVGAWARTIKDKFLSLQGWTTGMIGQMLQESVLHAKDHTSLKTILPFDPKDAVGLNANEIYLKIGDTHKCEQLVLEGQRLGLQLKSAKATATKRG